MKYLVPFFLVVLISALFFAPERECADIARIHIISNSDSADDIRVKGEVADAVKRVLRDGRFDSLESVESLLREKIPEIEAESNGVLRDNGMSYKASAEVGVRHFERQSLGSDAFPEGDYLSLVVTLGDGAGHNWWSVLFPDISFEASMATGEDGSRGKTVILSDGKIVKIRSVIYDIFKLMLTKR